MALPSTKTALVSPEAYFSLAEASETRLEYEHGEILDMGKTTGIHSELMLNTASALKFATKGRGCKVYAETVSLETEANGRYFLPDVMLTCDPRDKEDKDIKRYPGLVIEVLSEGSEKRDRGDKFLAYLKLPSLHYYLLISQKKVRIEVFGKMQEGKGWIFNYYEELTDVISLDQLDISLKVADVYEDVDLTPVSPENSPSES